MFKKIIAMVLVLSSGCLCVSANAESIQFQIDVKLKIVDERELVPVTYTVPEVVNSYRTDLKNLNESCNDGKCMVQVTELDKANNKAYVTVAF